MPDQAVKTKPVTVEAMDELLLSCKTGHKVESMFGSAPATLFCVERLTVPSIFLRFRVMVFGCEVAEVAYEQRQDGKIIREEL